MMISRRNHKGLPIPFMSSALCSSWLVRILCCALLLLSSCVTPPLSTQPDIVVIPKFPARGSNALSGVQFASSITGADEQGREQAIFEQVRQGNIPDFLRSFKAVSYKAQTRSGRLVTVTFWALSDYVAVGSNQDYVRVPMSPITAQFIADYFNMFLPTVKMVDLIYQTAAQKLDPAPFKPGPEMVTVNQFVKHNGVVQTSLKGQPPESMLAGHKKDIVISNQLKYKPGKVAIYGWHQRNGLAIQPLSTIHGDYYSDYSHGLRLIAETIRIDGIAMPLIKALSDPDLAPLVSYEGALKVLRYPTEKGFSSKKWFPHS